MLSDEKLRLRESLFAWLDIPQRHRGCHVEDKLKELGINRSQYTKWKVDWAVKAEGDAVRSVMVAREKINRKMMLADPNLLENNKKKTGKWTIDDQLDETDPEAWLNAQLMRLYKAVMESAEKGNAQSQIAAARLMHKLDNKLEVTIGLSADEIARRNVAAGEELQTFRKQIGSGKE